MADRTTIEAVLQATGVNAFRDEIDSAGDSLEGLEKKSGGLKRVGDNIEGLGDRITGFGGKMTAGVTTPIVGGMLIAIESTEEYREVLGKLEQNALDAGADVETMQGHLQRMAGISEDTEASVEGLSNLLVSGFEGDAMDTIIGQLEGASIRFSETLKFEGLADGLQETLATGEAIGPFAELLERLGIDLELFNIGLAEAAENGEAHNYVLETLAEHGLAETAQGFRDSNQALVESREATARFMDALAELGETLTPIVTIVTEMVADILEAFNALDEDTQKTILVVLGIAAAFGPVTLAVGVFISAIGKIAGVAAFLASPIGIIVGLFGLVVGAIAYLAITDKEFRQDFISGWDFITGIFENYSDNMKRGIDWIAEGWKNFIGAFGPDSKIGINEGLNAIFEEVNKWGTIFLDAGRELIGKLTFGIFGGLDETKDDMEAGGIGIAESVGDGLSKGFESVKGSFKERLKELRDLLPFSPPKDKSSPLVGLEKNGIMSNIAAGVNADSSLVDRAMRDALSAPDTDALNIERDLNISSRDLNSRFEHSIDNTMSNEPMVLNLNLGGQVYKAFVQNITDTQNRTVELELAY